MKAIISTTLVLVSVASRAYAQTDADWSRVSRLKPGGELMVVLKGTDETRRHFVSADEGIMRVLNLDDVAMPARTSRALREIASESPQDFQNAASGATFVNGRLRLSSAGVFDGDRKIADLQQVLETRARADIVEVRTRQKGQGFWGHLGPLGGYFVGALAGGYGGGLACKASVSHEHCDTGAVLKGMVVGAVVGTGYGFHAARRVSEDVIYRAP
jgi:hypothetical protein